MDENNVLVKVAFNIILFAGNARSKANVALDFLKNKDFENARKNIEEARKEITAAHREQTDIIQAEAAGESHEPCLLFTHAQDTLMTIMSEVNLAEKLIDLFEAFMKQ